MRKSSLSQLWKKGQIRLPPASLKIGWNEVFVKFSNSYYTDGNGLHTFEDSDQSQYIYCQSEPYWQNRVFPLFDQPDLKGSMQFHILAPAEWRVVSNQKV